MADLDADRRIGEQIMKTLPTVDSTSEVGRTMMRLVTGSSAVPDRDRDVFAPPPDNDPPEEIRVEFTAAHGFERTTQVMTLHLKAGHLDGLRITAQDGTVIAARVTRGNGVWYDGVHYSLPAPPERWVLDPDATENDPETYAFRSERTGVRRYVGRADFWTNR